MSSSASERAASHPAGLLLGAHVSAAGGVSNAPGNAQAIGAECFQLFTRNQHRWASKAISEKEARRFAEQMRIREMGPAIAHGSYLINLGGPEGEKAAKSREALIDELERAQQLAISTVVVHPGAHLGDGVAKGVERVAKNLDRSLETADAPDVRVALETTAGQGTVLGGTWEELAEIASQSRFAERIGFCADSAHLFAAGYDFRTEEGYARLVDELDGSCGIQNLCAWHLNDSKTELGSHKDRHAEIGEGHIGLEAIARIVADPRWTGIPGCLETPGGPEKWGDEIAVLRTRREGQR